MTWEKLKSREIVIGVLFVGFLPFGILIRSIDYMLGFNNYLAIPSSLIWFVAFGVSCLQRMMCPCPNCGEPYYIYKRFPKECYHCGAKPPSH